MTNILTRVADWTRKRPRRGDPYVCRQERHRARWGEFRRTADTEAVLAAISEHESNLYDVIATGPALPTSPPPTFRQAVERLVYLDECAQTAVQLDLIAWYPRHPIVVMYEAAGASRWARLVPPA